jgi:hypothetical protein
MKTKTFILMIFVLLMATIGFAQEKTKKQLKEERKIEKQKEIESMINARQFVFVANTALPQGYKSVNLSSNDNYVKFHPERIESYMPFYGKGYSGIGYGGSETGLKFDGKPEEYKVAKGKKNYQVTAVVKGENDTFKLSLSVGFEGSALLNISSNNRSSISYNGDISAPEKQEEKK